MSKSSFFLFLLMGAAPLAAAAAMQNSIHRYEGHMTVDKNGRILSRSGSGLPVAEGSGRRLSQERAVGRFSRIELFGIGDVNVRLGRAPAVTISADDNLLSSFTSVVEGDTLKIESQGIFPHAAHAYHSYQCSGHRYDQSDGERRYHHLQRF